MSTTCLLRTLKGSVDNSNLPKLGEFSLKLNAAFTNKACYFAGITEAGIIPVTLHLTDGVFKDNSTQESLGDTLQLPAYSIPYLVTSNSANCVLEVKNYYGLLDFRLEQNISDSIESLDTEYLQYTHLTKIVANLKGNLSLLGYNKNLSEIFLKGFSATLSGDIVELVSQMIQSGTTRTSFTFFNVGGGQTAIRFNGKQLGNVGTFFNTNSTLVWVSASKMYLKNGTTCVACLGYTDEEIATNIASGGIWAGVDAANVVKVD